MFGPLTIGTIAIFASSFKRLEFAAASLFHGLSPA
jgi:hypothetical protein